MMNRFLFSAVVVISFTMGCDSKSDGEKLEGKWQLSRMAGDFSFGLGPGKKSDGPEILIFTGDRFAFKNDDRHQTGITGSFSCDETKTPKQITFNFSGRTVVGIYKISSPHLSICVGEDDQVAPSDFRGGPRSRPVLLVFDLAEAK
jgi:uncharacterized protein (TIGR03067 family)